MGDVCADGAIGGRIACGTVLNVGEGLGKVVGLNENLLTVDVGNLPCAERRSLSCDLGLLGGQLRIGISGKHRSTGSAIRAGNGVGAAGRGGAHNDVAGTAADSGIDVGPNINQIELQTKFIGNRGGHVDVDADDGAGRLSRVRGVVGINAYGKRARLNEHGVRNGLLLLFGGVAARRAAAQHGG